MIMETYPETSSDRQHGGETKKKRQIHEAGGGHYLQHREGEECLPENMEEREQNKSTYSPVPRYE